MEGGPLLEDWWVEVSKNFVPYVNVTASRDGSFDGAPDQGLLREKGGRGFPYSVFMDVDGDVLWEVRPTSKEAMMEALADARTLADMKAKLAQNPDDEDLQASVKLFASFGMGQRQGPSFEELKELASSHELAPAVQKRWAKVRKNMAFEEYLKGLRENSGSQEEAFATAYEDWKGGKRPPSEDSMPGVNFIYMAVQGAVNAENLEHSKQLLGDLKSGIEAAGLPDSVYQRVGAPLEQKIEEMEK